MKAKFWIGLVFTTAIVVFAIVASGGSVLVYFDIPSLVMIALIPASIAFASWPLGEIRRAFTALHDPAAGRAELEKSALFFESIIRWMLYAAFAGLMIGLVAILRYYDGNQVGKLGRNLAVMLLCNTEALFLIIVFPLPLAAIARRRLAGLNGDPGATGRH